MSLLHRTRAREPRPSLVVAAVVTVSLVIVALAERDVHRRPADQIRGPKLLWRVLCANVTGVIAYLLFGRARSAGVTQ